jgi:hypothetical protein
MDCFYWICNSFPQSLHANVGIIPWNSRRPLSTTPFLINQSFVTYITIQLLFAWATDSIVNKPLTIRKVPPSGTQRYAVRLRNNVLPPSSETKNKPRKQPSKSKQSESVVLAAYLVYSSTLKMILRSSETSVSARLHGIRTEKTVLLTVIAESTSNQKKIYCHVY